MKPHHCLKFISDKNVEFNKLVGIASITYASTPLVKLFFEGMVYHTIIFVQFNKVHISEHTSDWSVFIPSNGSLKFLKQVIQFSFISPLS